jgi:hypothetical protein
MMAGIPAATLLGELISTAVVSAGGWGEGVELVGFESDISRNLG